VFRDMKKCALHISGKKPARKVILSAPAADNMPTFVMGVNHVSLSFIFSLYFEFETMQSTLDLLAS
jgi:hypothetical protein